MIVNFKTWQFVISSILKFAQVIISHMRVGCEFSCTCNNSTSVYIVSQGGIARVLPPLFHRLMRNESLDMILRNLHRFNASMANQVEFPNFLAAVVPIVGIIVLVFGMCATFISHLLCSGQEMDDMEVYELGNLEPNQQDGDGPNQGHRAEITDMEGAEHEFVEFEQDGNAPDQICGTGIDSNEETTTN